MIFVNRISPFIFRMNVWGSEVGLRWYGLAYVAGFVFGWLAFRRAIENGKIPGATPKTIDHLVTAIVVGVVVGGRLGFVIQNMAEWAKDPLFPLEVWRGGMAFFGGLAGVAIALAWVARRESVSFLALTDTAAPPALLGLALGRIANFTNRELWGRPTGGHWGVIYPNVDNLPRHPSELYESASHFLAFFALILLISRFRLRPGVASALFLILYGILRTITDFWREEPLEGPLNSGQWASLVIAALGFAMLLFLRSKQDPITVDSNLREEP